MNHNELLTKIESLADAWAEPSLNANALRAVVELHKPKIDNHIQEICSYCSEITFYSEMEEESYLYPCPTIQAIEKVLE